MMKFFRKHMKKILAVSMALLLVAWLGGSALSTLLAPNPAKTVVAHSKYGDIRGFDRSAAGRATMLLERLYIPWATPIDNPAMWPGEPLSIDDWILLSREARDMGISIGQQEVEDALRGVERGLQQRGARITILGLAAGMDVRPEQFGDAVADYLRIRWTTDMVAGAVWPSEAELRVAARDAFERVKIEAVVLRASTFVDPDKTYSQDQIDAQFQQYKDTIPTPATFGYYLPARVKVEYVKIDQAAINDDLRVSEARLIDKAKTYWRENRRGREFMKPQPAPSTLPTSQTATSPAEQVATQPVDEATTQPAGEPANRPTGETTTRPTTTPVTQPTSTAEQTEDKYFATFCEARETAIRIVRERLASETTERVARWLGQQFAEPWFEAELGQDGFKVGPERVKQPGYCDDIVSQLPPALPYAASVEVVTTDRFSEDEADDLPGIGQATVLLAEDRTARFGELVFTVQGLAEIPTEGRFDRARYLAQYQFSPLTLRDGDGNLYLFRVIDVEPAHAPESSDLVREQVLEDLRVIDGLAEGRKALEALRAKAVEAGSLAAAWEQDEDLKARAAGPDEGYVGPVGLGHPPRRGGTGTQPVPDLGEVDDDFVEACFALGNQTGDGPKLAVLDLPATARIALVQWVETIPLSADQYFGIRNFLVQNLALQRRLQSTLEWLDPKKIRARNEYKPARRRGKEEEKKEPEDNAD